MVSSLSFITGGRNRFGSLLSLGHHTGKADRLYMKGPGGRGEVEVAVSGVIGTLPFSFLNGSLLFRFSEFYGAVSNIA